MTCPCQDGDLCHYVDDPITNTKAMSPPSAVGRQVTDPELAHYRGAVKLAIEALVPVEKYRAETPEDQAIARALKILRECDDQ